MLPGESSIDQALVQVGRTSGIWCDHHAVLVPIVIYLSPGQKFSLEVISNLLKKYSAGFRSGSLPSLLRRKTMEPNKSPASFQQGLDGEHG